MLSSWEHTTRLGTSCLILFIPIAALCYVMDSFDVRQLHKQGEIVWCSFLHVFRNIVKSVGPCQKGFNSLVTMSMTEKGVYEITTLIGFLSHKNKLSFADSFSLSLSHLSLSPFLITETQTLTRLFSRTSPLQHRICITHIQFQRSKSNNNEEE